MAEDLKICKSCMNAVPAGAGSCPDCGYDGRQQNSPESLPIGHRLAGRYVVGMRKGGDGDCAIYVGYDCTLNRRIEIREYLPESACTRKSDGTELVPVGGAELYYKTALMDFSDLYKNLHKIEGVPGIVRTSDFFEANATAYAILDTFDGITLREFLSMAGGAITCVQAVKLLEPVFHAVEAIHKVNLIHRGISPDTIFLNRNGDVRLSGFATSRIRTMGTEIAGKLFGGYAAPEQYYATGWQSTATDVYALAAVYYRCVSGLTPQDAEQRRSQDTLIPLAEVKKDIELAVSRIIAQAMILDEPSRIQGAQALLDALKKPAEWLSPGRTAQAEPAQQETEIDDSKGLPRKSSGRYPAWVERLGVVNFWTIIVIVMVTVILVTAAVVLGQSLFGKSENPEDPEDPEMVQVPRYVGMTEEEARAQMLIDSEFFKFEEDFRNVDRPGETYGVVVEQTPASGTEAKKGTVIVLYINRSKTITVPSVTGDKLEVAIEKLKAADIPSSMIKVIEVVDDMLPEGTVIAQTPKGGDPLNLAAAGSKIELTVSKQSPSTVTSVTITPNQGSVQQGQSIEFTAVVVGTNIQNTGVLWTWKGLSVLPAGVSVSQNGNKVTVTVSAPIEVETSITLTATSIQDTTKSSEVKVTITAAGNG